VREELSTRIVDKHPILIQTDKSMSKAQFLAFSWLPSCILYVYTAIIISRFLNKLDYPAAPLPSCPVQITYRKVLLQRSKRVFKRIHDVFFTGSCAYCISKKPAWNNHNENIFCIYLFLKWNTYISKSSGKMWKMSSSWPTTFQGGADSLQEQALQRKQQHRINPPTKIVHNASTRRATHRFRRQMRK
jgi:hypothetical protein